MTETLLDQPINEEPLAPDTPVGFTGYSEDIKPPSLDGEVRKRFELASKYGPNPDADGLDREFAPGVLHSVREGWNEVRRDDPELFVGMTLHGSSVKGRMHENSDVDAAIFINPDAYEKGQHSWGEETRARFRVHHAIKSKLYDEMKYGPSLTEKRKSYTVYPINEGIIANRLKPFVSPDKHIVHGQTDTYSKEIVALFNLRLGEGDIAKYRKQVLDTLSRSPHGEELWGKLMGELHDDEEGKLHDEDVKGRGASIYLPQTLAEGYDYFKLDPTQPQAEAAPPKSRMRRLAARAVGAVMKPAA